MVTFQSARAPAFGAQRCLKLRSLKRRNVVRWQLARAARPVFVCRGGQARWLALSVTAGLAAVLSAMFSPANAGPRFEEWTTVKSERRGFAIAYPTSVFEQLSKPNSEDGRVFVSKDGKAKLLVGAFENEQANTLEEYRQFLLSEHYADAAIDYAPMKGRWFVLSGTQGGETFYQRVTFTCGGKLINSWAMIYPAAERAKYDRVLEAVAPTFTPGAGRTGSCD